jgi:hypothetical protein
MTAHSKHEDDLTWVPPQVTHDLSYASDEEIVPNHKAAFLMGCSQKYATGIKDPIIENGKTSHQLHASLLLLVALSLRENYPHMLTMTCSRNSLKILPL